MASDPRHTFYELVDAARLWQQTLKLRRGEPVSTAGSHDRNVYYVESGTLVSTIEIEGEEQCMRFGYAGDFIVALDTYISGQPSKFTTRALRKCSLRQIGYEEYRAFLPTSRAAQDNWQEIMSWMIYGQLEREIDLLTSSPEERYRRVLARSPRLFQEIPAKYIANYLRMTPETLSRIKKS